MAMTCRARGGGLVELERSGVHLYGVELFG
jgi:hypothetical protein